MKAIKRVIIIVTILIVSLIIFIFVFNKTNNEIDNKLGDEGKEIEYESDELKNVTDSIRFYTVNKCVYQYLDTINKQNSSYYGFDENRDYVLILSEKEIKEKVYKLLSTEYIKENNISIDNVYQYVDNIEEKLFFIPLQMGVVEKDTIEKYLVHGIVQTMENEYVKDIYLMVNLDTANKTFSIEPLDDYDSIDEINIKNNNINIEKNDENTYEYEKVNYEYIVKEYIDAYKKLALSSPEIVYNLLEEGYCEKRFGSIETFIKYIDDNSKEIIALQPSGYLTNQYQDYTEYVVKDKYNNLYIFNEKAPMDFSLQLDTYTIPTEKFKTEYNKSDDQNKIMLNVDKWIQMLNNRDYSAAYEVLDETFRNNNFGSEEQFEQYMREKFPLHYELEFGEYSNEADIGIQKIVLTDITGEDSTIIENTIIMQLEDDYNFVMSFEIQ